MSAQITLTGRLTAAPELRFTAQGMAVAAFTIVTSRRVKDPASGEWSDSDTTFWDCKAFKQLAENIVESLDKGLAVIAVGRAVQESWEKDGEKRSKIVFRVDEIAPSLRFTTAKVTKASGGSGRQEFQQARQQGASEDPWAQQASGGWGGGSSEAPPF